MPRSRPHRHGGRTHRAGGSLGIWTCQAEFWGYLTLGLGAHVQEPPGPQGAELWGRGDVVRWGLDSVQIESETVGCGSVQMWPELWVSWDSVSEVNKADSARRAGS